MFDLSKISIFSGLTAIELEPITKFMKPLMLEPGTLVIQEGEKSSNLYIVESGELEVFISNAAGSKFDLNTLRSGSYFGEFAFLDNATRSASVLTTTKSKLYEIKKQDFIYILDHYPIVYKIMVQNLVKTIHHKDEQIKQLSLQNIYPSLRQYLIDQSTLGYGSRKKSEILTPSVISKLINCPVDIVAYLLSFLEDKKFINIDGDSIYIYKTLPLKISD